jgi:hypothetical protein
MTDTSYRSFFGDAEYTFCITAPMLQELEAKRGVGFLALSMRVFTRQCAHADITEILRVALVGGGTSPKRAAELIAAYAADRPLSETWPLTAKILERLLCGNPESINGQA